MGAALSYLWHSFLFSLFPCSIMGFHPWEIVLHELPHCGLLLWWYSTAHTALVCVPPTESSSAGAACFSVAPPQLLPADLLQSGLLSLWGHRSCQEPTPIWVFSFTPSCRHPPALEWGPAGAACSYWVAFFLQPANLWWCAAAHRGTTHFLTVLSLS